MWVCDPSFEPIDRLGRAEAIIALPPCPRCPDGAEKGVEMIGARIIAKTVRRVYAEAVALWRLLAKGLQQMARASC